MPTPVFLFFVIGGALLALTTTLNATFAWITKPILQACNDGWLPHKIGYIHPKFKTPVIILVGFYIVGLIPILTGLQISMIADTAVVLSNILFAFICFGTVFIPQRMPELWEVSAFRCSKSKLYLKSILGGVSCVVMVLVLFFQMSMPQAVSYTHLCRDAPPGWPTWCPGQPCRRPRSPAQSSSPAGRIPGWARGAGCRAPPGIRSCSRAARRIPPGSSR